MGQGRTMMHRFMLCVFACLLPLQALSPQALAQSAEEQLLAALGVFRPTMSMGEVWLTHPKLTEYLAGRWLLAADALFAGGAKAIAPDKLKLACEKSGVDVSVSRYSITFTKVYKRKDGSMATMETVYADHGGNVYGFMTPPEQYLDRLGLADITEEKYLPGKYNVLRNASGIAHLFRSSKDVLVILPIADRAQFAMRCP